MAGERSVNDLAEALEATQSNGSRHLQALHDAGLVARRREGVGVYYRIGDPVIFELCKIVCDSTERRMRAKLGLMPPRKNFANGPWPGDCR